MKSGVCNENISLFKYSSTLCLQALLHQLLISHGFRRDEQKSRKTEENTVNTNYELQKCRHSWVHYRQSTVFGRYRPLFKHQFPRTHSTSFLHLFCTYSDCRMPRRSSPPLDGASSTARLHSAAQPHAQLFRNGFFKKKGHHHLLELQNAPQNRISKNNNFVFDKTC